MNSVRTVRVEASEGEFCAEDVFSGAMSAPELGRLLSNGNSQNNGVEQRPCENLAREVA